MSALTDDQLKAEKRCKEIIKSLGNGPRSAIIEHLANLQTVELERLMTSTDTVRIHRAQGASQAIQSVIDLLAGKS